jgi:hypothetical protein
MDRFVRALAVLSQAKRDPTLQQELDSIFAMAKEEVSQTVLRGGLEVLASHEGLYPHTPKEDQVLNTRVVLYKVFMGIHSLDQESKELVQTLSLCPLDSALLEDTSLQHDVTRSLHLIKREESQGDVEAAAERFQVYCARLLRVVYVVCQSVKPLIASRFRGFSFEYSQALPAALVFPCVRFKDLDAFAISKALVASMMPTYWISKDREYITGLGKCPGLVAGTLVTCRIVSFSRP